MSTVGETRIRAATVLRPLLVRIMHWLNAAPMLVMLVPNWGSKREPHR